MLSEKHHKMYWHINIRIPIQHSLVIINIDANLKLKTNQAIWTKHYWILYLSLIECV